MAKPLTPDLFTFVAEIAVKRGDPTPITFNCGGVITIMPPLQEELIICAKCESRIKLLVLSGDPGYVMGRSPNGEPMLIPVQGSSKEKLQISAYRFGLLVTLYLLFSACLAWHLGSLASKSPSTIGALDGSSARFKIMSMILA